jgi:hypothetical protein
MTNFGREFSHSRFDGGALVTGDQENYVIDCLTQRAKELGLTGEIKWQKTTPSTFERYMELMDTVFELIAAGRIKIRIFFTQSAREAVGLTKEQTQNEFFLLYYQFIKHAFGLSYSNPDPREAIHLQIAFDKLPNNRGHREDFKRYIIGLQRLPEFRRANIMMSEQDFMEVDSKKHIILQCMDVIMGSMNFRLNNLHLVKAPETNRRGKRTIAKEKLYKHINKRICELRPHFNIGITTGDDGAPANRWHQGYRHWNFVPSNHEYREERTKRHNLKKE